VTSRRLTYMSLQATDEWQGASTHVTEVVAGLRRTGWHVDLHQPVYRSRHPRTRSRIGQFAAVQARAAASARGGNVLYVRHHPAAAAASTWWRGVRLEEVNGTLDDFFTAHPWSRRIQPALGAASRRALRTADMVIVPNVGLADWVKEFAGEVPTTVIPNGVNPQLFHPGRAQANQPPYVVFVGALVEWEGLDQLLSAVEQPEWPEGVRLLVAGDGKMRPAVEQAAARWSHVEYLGALPYAAVGEWVAGALASLSPNTRARWGASPLKLYEALACGTPVIATDTAGQSELVRDSACGQVVPLGDGGALARAVARIALDEDLRCRYAQNALAASSEHTWDTRVRHLNTVIERLLHSGTARPHRTRQDPATDEGMRKNV
jgi:glycosyltransferase involved in cell wall biosynthesis